MSTEITQRYYYQHLRIIIMVLLLISSNQTTSVASNKTHDFQQMFHFSAQSKIEIIAQNNNKQSGVDGQQYSITAYSIEKNHSSQLISAITRPLKGRILEVLIEDINDDQQKEIVVIMESEGTDKPFLMLDTYSFNGKKMLWKQKLSKNLLSSHMHTYLENHEVPSSLPRNTATVSLTL